jgi:hypothetical protein
VGDGPPVRLSMWREGAQRSPFFARKGGDDADDLDPCAYLQECLRTIKGARDLSRSDLEAQRWISPHIWKLKDAQEQ